MPSEVRHIIFTTAEVVQAIVAYRRKTGQPLPPGSIVKHEVDTGGLGGEVRFSLVIAPDRAPVGRDNATVRIVLEGSTLTAALIATCLEAKIPMPMRAEKNLQLVNRQICLVVSRQLQERSDNPL